MDCLYVRQAKDALNVKDTEPESKCSSLSRVCFAVQLVLVPIVSSRSRRVGFPLFGKGNKTSHCPLDRWC